MKRALRVGGFVLALMACFAFGFSWRDLRHGEMPQPRALERLLSSVSSKPVSSEQIFKDAYHKIISSYAREVKPRDLKYAGISGMMASLGDPHTMFLPPDANEQFMTETRARFVGVGAKLGRDALGAKAARVFESGPAYAAGMRAGDIITAVDAVSTAGKSVEDIVKMIRGKEGTIVKLTVLRDGADKEMVLNIKRASVVIPTVDSDYLEKHRIGYMAVSTFSEPTSDQFDEELLKLERKGLKGLIIDVRDNPGGLLESARDLLSRFAENKVVVKMQFRNGTQEVSKTYAGFARPFSYPVVVLINENSASAAEIFAGVLKDYRLATLVGDHTYGKASVQNVFELVDGSSAKITIAKYLLPYGGDISRTVDEDGLYKGGGLSPDVEAKVDFFTRVEIGNPEKDPQLQKAIELIASKAR